MAMTDVDGLPDLPVTTITKDRQVVDTSASVWRFRASSDGGRLHLLDWGRLTSDSSFWLTPRALRIFQLYLSQRLRYLKGYTVANDFEMLNRFLRWLSKHGREPDMTRAFSWDQLAQSMMRSFLEYGMATTDRGNDFVRLRDFYRWGAFVGRFPEFDRQVALSLKAIRAQGNVKGAAVRFAHVTRGPLDVAERQLITAAFRSGLGTPQERAVVMIHLELGPNPLSVARLRNEDLQKFEVKIVEKGSSITRTRYQLAMPRVKKRTEFRQVKVRPISLELGKLLEQLRSSDQHDRLFHWLNHLYPEHHIRVIMSDFVKQADIVSPRTSQPLLLSPRRFRYTLGTEAAKEGASPASIAELLDHSDLQNVGVYVEASSYVVDQLGQKFDEFFEPIAQRFRGQIVDSQSKSAFPGIPPKVIPSTSAHLPIVPMDLGGIGLCGRDVRKDGLCRLAPPLTCYPCEFFAAFRNGPHREVLEALERVRDELKKSSDLRIPMQLDDVVAAVKQLVLQIENERKVANASAV
jgi:integrase